MFQQSVGFFTTATYNETELNIMQNIVNKTSYSVQQVIELMQCPCDELLLRCRFEGEVVPCQNIFKPVVSQYGLCCTFNKNNTQSWVSKFYYYLPEHFWLN